MPVAPRGVGAISSVLGEGGAASAGRPRGESTPGVCSCCAALGMVAMKSPSGEASTASARRLKGESTSAVEARRRVRRRLAASTAGTTATAPLLVRVRVGPLAIHCSGSECVWIVGGATIVPVSHSSSESTAAAAAIATAAASATPLLPPTAAEIASVPSLLRTAGPGSDGGAWDTRATLRRAANPSTGGSSLVAAYSPPSAVAAAATGAAGELAGARANGSGGRSSGTSVPCELCASAAAHHAERSSAGTCARCCGLLRRHEPTKAWKALDHALVAVAWSEVRVGARVGARARG